MGVARQQGDRPPWDHIVQRRVSESVLPRISAFFGIVITMYYNDHSPPHFHARYGEHEAQFVIGSLEVLHGSLPPRALELTRQWALLHVNALHANWDAARRGEPLSTIPGLE